MAEIITQGRESEESREARRKKTLAEGPRPQFISAEEVFQLLVDRGILSESDRPFPKP